MILQKKNSLVIETKILLLYLKSSKIKIRKIVAKNVYEVCHLWLSSTRTLFRFTGTVLYSRKDEGATIDIRCIDDISKLHHTKLCEHF